MRPDRAAARVAGYAAPTADRGGTVHEDWATQATDTIDRVVGVLRDRTVVPARSASRAVVFGLLASAFVGTAVVLLVVGAFRALVLLTERVWIAHLVVGGILVLGGMLCWARREPHRDDRQP